MGGSSDLGGFEDGGETDFLLGNVCFGRTQNVRKIPIKF